MPKLGMHRAKIGGHRRPEPKYDKNNPSIPLLSTLQQLYGNRAVANLLRSNQKSGKDRTGMVRSWTPAEPGDKE